MLSYAQHKPTACLAHSVAPVEPGARGADTNMLKLRLHSALQVVKTFVSDPGVSLLLSASVKPTG